MPVERCSIAANKWDLVEEKDATFKHLSEEAAPFANATIMRTSRDAWTGGPPTPAGRWWTSTAGGPRASRPRRSTRSSRRRSAERPTPRDAGTLHYATQVASGPPAFVIFGGARAPDPSYQRYLENRLRRTFDSRRAHRLTFRPRTRRPKPGGKRHGSLAQAAHASSRMIGEPRGPRRPLDTSSAGRGAAWLARLSGGQKVAGSNPAGPTDADGRSRRCLMGEPTCPNEPRRPCSRSPTSSPSSASC